MSEKKAENEDGVPHEDYLCETCLFNGSKRPAKARFGEPVRYCANHDPEQAARRANAGKKRAFRFAQGDVDPTKLPTLDGIVDQALDLVDVVASGKLDPSAGRACAMLLQRAIDAMKARSHVGDLPIAKKVPIAGGLPIADDEVPGTLKALEEALDS
jgi:hypothetical protein